MFKPVEAVNPILGMHIKDCDDFAPVGFTDSELVATINDLSATRHDYDMLLESASFEEVDEYWNPGTEDVPDHYVLEAIVVDKFSRTDRRMAAVVRVLNKHLVESEINALDPIVGKPKKAGSYAYVTVQLPFSDGQVVSVIFHSPEGDRKKIGPSDQIIAFRWLLNKRDITAVVAPEDGSEISLETIARRLTQLVEKNSKRFEATQKQALAERQELEKLKDQVKEAEDRQRELMSAVGNAQKDADSAEAELSNTLALLEKQKTINAELQAKLDALKRAKGTGGGADGLPQVAALPAGVIRGRTKKEAIEAAKEWVARNAAAPVKTLIGDVIVNAACIKNSFGHGFSQAKLDAVPAIVPTLENGAYLGALPDKDGKPITNHYFTGRVKLGADEKVIFARVRKAEGDQNRFYVHEIFTEDEIKKAADSSGTRNTTPDLPGTTAFYKNLIAQRLEVKEDGGDGSETGDPLNEDEAPALPPFVNDLNDILKGRHDGDTARCLDLLENAINEVEKTGLLAEYDGLLNDASNHVTDLLAREAAQC